MRTFLIGLGGSGVEVVSRLKKLLAAKLDDVNGAQREALEKRFGDVSCVIMDTDQRVIPACTELGIDPIILSSRGTVGSYLNALESEDHDVFDWCPSTDEEGPFFGEPLQNGASQCRMKSRLCLSVFLKDELNELAQLFDHVQSVHGELNKRNLRFMIISSIAGGTGSGTFIQVALYIKNYFRKRFGVDVLIHGLFACPDLYKAKVSRSEWESIYANAYACIRELNAMNVVYGKAATPQYGKNIKIRIDSKSEGNLFSPKQAGLYSYKPFDQLYFIDDVNAIGGTISGLDTYYDTMSEIVYSHMFSPIAAAVESCESNEMEDHSQVPLAIYGSAGTATMEYPYDDIVSYLASRFVKDSVSNVWTALDADWREYVRRKELAEQAKGLVYRPTPEERQSHYINAYSDAVYQDISEEKNEKFAFLRNVMEVDEATLLPHRVYNYLKELDAEALRLVRDENSLRKLKTDYAILDKEINRQIDSIKDDIDEGGRKQDSDVFDKIGKIDEAVVSYAKACGDKIKDIADTLSVQILCDNAELWKDYDKYSCSITKGLLLNQEGQMVHPLAVRYLLYCFRQSVAETLEKKNKDSKSAKVKLKEEQDNLVDYAEKQANVLQPEKGEKSDKTTVQILHEKLGKLLVGPGLAKDALDDYAKKTILRIQTIENAATEAITYFALADVYDRLSALIQQFELFFDKIDDYKVDLERSVRRFEMDKNAPGRTVVYVGASPARKRALYADVSKKMNPDSGEAAASISQSLFSAVRENLWNSDDDSLSGEIVGMSEFFKSIRLNVEKFIANDSYIRPLIDKDVFTAMLDDYAAEKGAKEIEKFDPESKGDSPFGAYLKKQMGEILARSAPMLNYDVQNTYALYYTKDPNELSLISVSHPYVFLEMHPSIANSIKDKLYFNESDEIAAVKAFIAECTEDRAPRLPSFSREAVNPVINEDLTPREIFMYSTVHCLQPYQIPKFDESRGGDYYTNYCSRMKSVLEINRLSRSPHLDKRWHKRGMMPYVNISMEIKSRYSLVKAFVYAMLYNYIQCYVDRNTIYYHFYDEELNIGPMTLTYNDMPITNYDLSKILYWLMNRENIVEHYAKLFDEELDAEELELAAKFRADVREYEALVTQNRLIHYLREDMIGVSHSKNAMTKGEKKFVAVPPIGILKVAAHVHYSEERIVDYDYGEEIINVAEEVIFRFARAPFSIEQLKKQNGMDDTGITEQRNAFQRIIAWNKLKFLESYCSAEMEERNLSGKHTASAGASMPAEAEPDSNRLKPRSSTGSPINKPLQVRDVPSKILTSAEYLWINQEFDIDPDMEIDRPEMEE